MLLLFAGLVACSSQQLPPPAASAAPPPATTAATTPPPPALRVEGAPPLSSAVLAATQRYSRIAGHAFVDWHPQRLEMLVSHRPPGASTSQLYRVAEPMATPQALTDGADPVTTARYEPTQGRYLVFARGSGGNEAYQLFRLALDAPASQPNLPVQITPSDQRHALIGWAVMSGQPALAVVTSVPLDRTAQGGTRTTVNTTLSLVDPSLDPQQTSSRRTVAELPGGGWFGGEVSPDGTQLAITRYVSAAQSEVWLVGLAGAQLGITRQVLPQPLPQPGQALQASHFTGGWSQDGKQLFLTSDRSGEFRQLMRLDLPSGALVNLSAATAWDADWGSRSADGQHAAFVVNADGRDELRVLDAHSGAARDLPKLPGGSVTRAEFHPRRSELALVVNSAQGPSQIHTLDLPTGKVTAWTQAVGTAGMNLQAIPDQQIVRWKSFDGRVISGVLSLPPARFTGRRPVVMAMHGGPEGQSKQGWQGRTNYLLEELGVAVLEPNVRGSTGYGKTFLALDNGRLREDSVKDMGSAIDWVATHPRLDAQRVLVTGGSYGGYMALAASTRLASRIAGAMSAVGISNFVSFLENTESYRRDLRRVEYGDERDPAMRAFLTSISPLTHVGQITKPLMVVQGKNDPRVPWTESEQIVRSLQQRGTPVWYLLADNEGHGFARRENSDHYFATLVQFVQATLKP
jgi:dipeptidyl aminopeptidase/acylaminoacyl peptidase